MQDTLQVWEPKSFFKKGKERQVFLFELAIVVAKKLDMPSKTVRYVVKGKPIMVRFITMSNINQTSLNVLYFVPSFPREMMSWNLVQDNKLHAFFECHFVGKSLCFYPHSFPKMVVERFYIPPDHFLYVLVQYRFSKKNSVRSLNFWLYNL